VNTYAIKKYGFIDFEEEIIEYVLNNIMPKSNSIKIIIEEFNELHRLSERGLY
jgi:hypothetical protein